MNSPQYRQSTAPFTFPPTSTSSPPLLNDHPETAEKSSGPDERELRLINARKKLKNYRLKQAAAKPSSNKSTSLNNLPPSAPNTLSPLVATTSPSITRHKHTRTHSRNQSRSSLASILVSSEQVSLIDNALAHHRRLSLSKPPPSLPNSHLSPSEPNSNRSSLPPPTPTFVSTPWAGNTEPHKRTHSHHVVHVRRESKHMRKNSVSTRRESIEIMGGLGIIGVLEPPRALNRGSWSGLETWVHTNWSHRWSLMSHLHPTLSSIYPAPLVESYGSRCVGANDDVQPVETSMEIDNNTPEPLHIIY
ncbi:hypothetical protein CROQUDRAFT_87712 [Cronartium quercuum f. sp. fusiforme G11]|uniref:Uncharacterized protein n=1 Tax=Cronartium quercuum f. sp. fusiforme G11 TaxID=708437 RepID=A0A9P6NRX7_9BASI|nr:hypothetical protein CROQUDRAFT_87712 [Cronartium quercuum f. sp. fusiforme G11]